MATDIPTPTPTPTPSSLEGPRPAAGSSPHASTPGAPPVASAPPSAASFAGIPHSAAPSGASSSCGPSPHPPEDANPYRIEQMRLLRRRVLGRAAVQLAAWVVACIAAFSLASVTFVPWLADVVFYNTLRYTYVPPSEAGLVGTPAFTESVKEAQVRIIASYLGVLDDEENFVDGAIPAMGDDVAALKEAVQTATDAASAEAGDALEIDPYGLEATNPIVELRESDPDAFARVLAEAMGFFGIADEASLVISFPYDSGYYDQRTTYYADGSIEYIDSPIYDWMSAMKLPAAVAIFLAGVVVIVWRASARSLKSFDALFGAMEDVLRKRDVDVSLPRELAPTSRALERIRRENEMSELAARAAEQRKNELVAYLAHDIRTPLTSIIGYLTMLKESPKMPVADRERYAGIALDRSLRLEGMLEEFFEITRYNLQSIPIERERFDVALLCNQVADEFYPTASARGISIEVDAPAGAEAFADPDKVSRVLNNLLKNAVGYADADSTVRVRARMVGGAPEAMGESSAPGSFGAHEASAAAAVFGSSAASGGLGSSADSGAPASGRELVVDVESSGREISPAHLQAIFERFYREDASRTTGRGGAELGLAIAREIARAHGGVLTARSERDTTTFTLRIPA